MSRVGTVKSGKSFKYAVDRFMDEYSVPNEGQRSPSISRTTAASSESTDPVLREAFRQRDHARLGAGLPDSPGQIRPARRTAREGHGERNPILTQHNPSGNRLPPAGTLKYANRQGWLTYLPDISAPYKASGKIGHRTWFFTEEYKRFYQATRKRAKNPLNERWHLGVRESPRFCAIHGEHRPETV